MEEIAKLLAQAKENMSSAVAFFEKELQKVRAGKSSPQMLEGLKVDYYGNPTPIEQVGNISTPDARQIIVQPWERNMLQPIEKAILAANLGFTPQNTGEFIRIVVPTPTEERRKELVKQAKQDAEQLKVSIRNIRRSANDAAKSLLVNSSSSRELSKSVFASSSSSFAAFNSIRVCSKSSVFWRYITSVIAIIRTKINSTDRNVIKSKSENMRFYTQ